MHVPNVINLVIHLTRKLSMCSKEWLSHLLLLLFDLMCGIKSCKIWIVDLYKERSVFYYITIMVIVKFFHIKRRKYLISEISLSEKPDTPAMPRH